MPPLGTPSAVTTAFVDVIDVVHDATIPYDWHFFHSLDHDAQQEPWLERDKVMIDELKSIGIEKNKPLNPDQKMRTILNEAVGKATLYGKADTKTYSPAQLFRYQPMDVACAAGLHKRSDDQLHRSESYLSTIVGPFSRSRSLRRGISPKVNTI
jgi:hypothetical protein